MKIAQYLIIFEEEISRHFTVLNCEKSSSIFDGESHVNSFTHLCKLQRQAMKSEFTFVILIAS